MAKGSDERETGGAQATSLPLQSSNRLLMGSNDTLDS